VSLYNGRQPAAAIPAFFTESFAFGVVIAAMSPHDFAHLVDKHGPTLVCCTRGNGATRRRTSFRTLSRNCSPAGGSPCKAQYSEAAPSTKARNGTAGGLARFCRFGMVQTKIP
jgi:hypothetical protein